MLQRAHPSRLLTIIMGSSFLLNLSFGAYRSVFSNFAGQELGISAADYGLLEGIREIPGLLTVLLVVLAYRFSDERLYAISAGLLGTGIWLYASAHTYADLVVATLVQSVGFHVWYVVQDSMIMKSAQSGDRALRLGQINSIAAMATLLGMGVVWATGQWLTLRHYFLFAGLAGVAGALLSLVMTPGSGGGQRAGFVLRWRYRSYYVLTLLSGARRHIVLTFASFALVKLYHTPVQTVALLLAGYSFLAIWTRPLIGKLIDRVGEQRALSFNYGIIAVVFLGYAFIRSPWIAYSLFIVDNLMTGFDIAVSTHAGRIIPKSELSASLATGTTINHIFGVAVPVVGGQLWEWFGPRVPFLMGAAIVLIAMAYSWNLDARLDIADSADLPATAK